MVSSTTIQRASVWFDAIWICGSGILSFELRRWFGESVHGATHASPDYLAISAITSLLAYSLVGLNRRSTLHASKSDVLSIAVVAMIGPLIALTITFLSNRSEDVARSIPVFQTLLVFMGLVGLRVFTRFFLAKLLVFRRTQAAERERLSASGTIGQKPLASSKILVVGQARNVANYLRALETVHGAHFEVAGILVSEQGLAGCSIRGAAILGHPDDLAAVIDTLKTRGINISQVVVANGAASLAASVSEYLAASNIAMFDFDDLFLESEGQSTPADDRPRAYELKAGPRRYAPFKRAIDIVISGIGLILSLPFMLMTAVLVRFMLGTPVLFWQWRPGLHGRPFRLIKFRSMRNPLGRHGEILSDQARLGVFGRMLRRSRFDELPQLFNILIGEMSLIGPRPLIEAQQEKYGPRLGVRPGLSGWAQVHGGHLVSDEQKLAMDLWYVDRSSFWLDIKILVLTVRVIVWGDQPELARAALKPEASLTNPVQTSPVQTRASDRAG